MRSWIRSSSHQFNFYKFPHYSSSASLPSEFEGFGSQTQGAESSPTGFSTYRVTNLNNSGSGSFRDAVSVGSRLIVFDVGGSIPLTDLNITASYLTIDGLTAPSPGITFTLQTNADGIALVAPVGGITDVIVRAVRITGTGGHGGQAQDMFGLDGASGPIRRIIVDHCTFNSSNDGHTDMFGDVQYVSISNCLHRRTETAINMLNGTRANISIFKNCFTRCNERMIRFADINDIIDLVNNIIYGWGWVVAGGGAIQYRLNASYPTVNVVNNYYRFVSGLFDGAENAIRDYVLGAPWYEGNTFPAGETDDVSIATSAYPIPAWAQINTLAASALGTALLPTVGTVFRTTTEQVDIDEVASDLP